jgi:hypothetical protein
MPVWQETDCHCWSGNGQIPWAFPGGSPPCPRPNAIFFPIALLQLPESPLYPRDIARKRHVHVGVAFPRGHLLECHPSISLPLRSIMGVRDNLPRKMTMDNGVIVVAGPACAHDIGYPPVVLQARLRNNGNALAAKGHDKAVLSWAPPLGGGVLEGGAGRFLSPS